MKKPSKITTRLYWMGSLLLVLGLVKFIWSIIEIAFLPATGVNPPVPDRAAGLFYAYRLASREALKPPPKPHRQPRKNNLVRNLTLKGIYRGPDHEIAIIAKGTQTFLVSEGEKILGYKVKALEDRAVVLSQSGKEYRLELPGEKFSAAIPAVHRLRKGRPSASNKPQNISTEDGTTIVPKTILTDYASHLDKIWKNIGIQPYRKGGALKGFQVRFIRKDSDFEKLGLRRGDIITAINGEEIVDYSTPMEIMKNLESLDALSLQIKRGKKELELEYEVR